MKIISGKNSVLLGEMDKVIIQVGDKSFELSEADNSEFFNKEFGIQVRKLDEGSMVQVMCNYSTVEIG